MAEMRKKRAALGLVRREVWIHKSRSKDLAKIVKTLQKPD